jgi:hypothetical protein
MPPANDDRSAIRSASEGAEMQDLRILKPLKTMARETGLEPAASAVTGRTDINQINLL